MVYDPARFQPEIPPCPSCHGDEAEQQHCRTCDGEGVLSETEYRDWLADARAEGRED